MKKLKSCSLKLLYFISISILIFFTSTHSFISFLSQLILLIGTKLHHVVVQLAVEIMDTSPLYHQFKLRDDLFWFGKPHLLLWLIQFISFQVNVAYIPLRLIVVYDSSHFVF